MSFLGLVDRRTNMCVGIRLTSVESCEGEKVIFVNLGPN